MAVLNVKYKAEGRKRERKRKVCEMAFELLLFLGPRGVQMLTNKPHANEHGSVCIQML